MVTSSSSWGVRELAKKGKQKKPFSSVAVAIAPPKKLANMHLPDITKEEVTPQLDPCSTPNRR